MRKPFINLQNFANVLTGKTAKAEADIGPRYHKITLDYQEGGVRVNEATMIASIEEIVLKINKVEQWRISPADLFALERSYNKDFSVDDGLIHLYFSNRAVEGQLQQESTAIGTLGVSSLSVEVKLAAGIVPAITLEAYAEVDNKQEAPGLIRKLQSSTKVINSVGDFKESISRRGASYRALHFFEVTDGDITNLRFQFEGEELLNHDTDALHSMLKEYGYTAAAKQVVLPFDKRVLGDALPTQVEQANGQLRDASMRLTMTMGAAANVRMVEDFYATPNA